MNNIGLNHDEGSKNGLDQEKKWKDNSESTKNGLFNILGDDGIIKIEDVIYQRVGADTPAKYLWGIKGFTVYTHVKDQILESQEWKDKYIREVKTKSGGVVEVVNLNSLKQLLESRLGLKLGMLVPEIGDDGKVEIKGMIYQQVGENIPIDQLWGIRGIDAYIQVRGQSQEWKDKYVRQARTKLGGVVEVVEIFVLKKLLESKIGLPEIGDDGKVEIKGIIYQYISKDIPTDQLWGISGIEAYIEVRGQSQEWKDRYVKQAKDKNGSIVEVFDIVGLKQLLEYKIGLPEVGYDGKVKIDGIGYQQVSENTPANQLWGISGIEAYVEVRGQSQEWKDKYMKQAKDQKMSIVEVVDITGLKQLLEAKIGVPIVGDDRKVEINIESEIHTFVVNSYSANYKESLQNQFPEWNDTYVRLGRLQNGTTVEIVEHHVLDKFKNRKSRLPELGDNGRVEIDGLIYQGLIEHALLDKFRYVNGTIVKNCISQQNQEWKDKYVKNVKRYTGSNLYMGKVVELNALKKILEQRITLSDVEIGDDGRVELDGEMYQGVSVYTSKELLLGVDGAKVVNLITNHSQEWQDKYVKRISKTPVISQGIRLVNLDALNRLLDDMNSWKWFHVD